MRLTDGIRFQKTLALFAAASNSFEAVAAELAARRLLEVHQIDPTIIPNASLYNRMNFADNALLKKLRDEWREQHPLPAPATTKVDDGSYLDVSPITFNIDNFRKYTQHKKKRKPAVQLTRDDHETIRMLLNQGLGVKAVAARVGHTKDTVNSTRAYHIRSGKWVRIDGRFHWADRVQEPVPTNPQPSAENSEQNASTSSP